MSVRLMADVLEHVHDLTSGQKLLLVCLANYANEKGECWPSISTLSAQVDMSPRHVSGMLHELVKHGYLAIFEHTGKSNSYRVSVAQPTNHSSGVQPPQPTNHSSPPPEPQFVGTPDPEFVGPLNHSSSPLRLTVNEPSEGTVNEPSGGDPPAELEEKPAVKPKAVKPHRIPDDFAVDDLLRQWGYDRGLTDPDMDRATERFVNYWQGCGKSKTDWRATWRSWLLKDMDEGRIRKPTAAPVLGRTALQMERLRNGRATEIETKGVMVG